MYQFMAPLFLFVKLTDVIGASCLLFQILFYLSAHLNYDFLLGVRTPTETPPFQSTLHSFHQV